MGLDMYLIRKKYVGAEFEHRKVKGTIDIEINGKKLPIQFDRLGYIEEDVGYWRKANAIHNWFVENVQDGEDDCKNYYVSIEDLQKLLDLCKKVKEKAIIKKGQIANGYTYNKKGEREPIMIEGEYVDNSEEIADILPTTEGFFFGDTNYDQWYMQNIDYTIELLEKLIKDEKELNELGFHSTFEYTSSW